MSDSNKSSRDILKSTSIIGGSKIFAIIISIVQVKIIAILLGPDGVGSVSLFTSTVSIVGAITSFGINFSAVRNVAIAVASNNNDQVSRIIIIVKRWVIFSGVLGFALMALFSDNISKWTFGDESKAFEISFLAITLLFASVSGGQSAILRGHRRIKDLGKINIYGALLGFFISIPIYYFYKEDGIVPVLVLMNLSTLITSWYFANRINLKTVNVSIKETWRVGLDFVKLGTFNALTGFFMAGSFYLVRIMISDTIGIKEVGFFAVASALSIKYLDIILQTLGTDYFPRLSAVQSENLKLNVLVNEQTMITLLIGTPLVLFMLTFPDLLITILYSSAFSESVFLLMWMTIGIYIKLVLWPIGFVFLAKANSKIFIFTQSIWHLVFIGFSYFGLSIYGIEAIGMAFSVAYLITYLINLSILKTMNKFHYETKLLRIIIIMLVLVVSSFVLGMTISSNFKYVLTILALCIGLLISIYQLNEIVSFKKLFKKFIRKG